MSGRRHRRNWSDAPPRTKRLRRDRRRAKIAGVCAGLAGYYGAEPWLVRCIALTGLVFFPQIVFPAYWVMFFVMGRSPRRHGCRGEPGWAAEASVHTASRDQVAREPLRRPAPRRMLRNVHADLMQAELRLRRMEAHVTSGQYELQKAFQEIDDNPAPR